MAQEKDVNRVTNEHFYWGQRLKNAIESGYSDITVEQAAKDTLCELGKWLYGVSFSSKGKSLPEYKEMIVIHKQFHQHAAEILSLALAGNRAEAFARLSVTAEYATASLKVTRALRSLNLNSEKTADPQF